MMCVLHVNSSAYASTSPTMRIARYAANRLGCALIHDKLSATVHRGVKFDTVLAKYGVLKFSDHRDAAVEIHENARRVINLENDYTMVPDKRFSPAKTTWSTVEGKDSYVNWNVLTRHGAGAWQRPRMLPVPHREGVVYYGAHRPGRARYFKHYFKDAPYPVTISTFRGATAFKETCGDSVELCGAFKDPDMQAQWKLTVYMEDEASHDLYCSPATRFYECVMAGVAQVIDESAVHTLTKAGVDVPREFVVSSQSDVARALRNWHGLQTQQRELWFKDYAAQLNAQFDKAARKEKLT